MFTLFRLVGWVAGIGAGAQVAGGVLRAVGKLARDRPGAAVIEVADGLLAPVRSACQHVVELAGDAVDLVTRAEAPVPEPPPAFRTPPHGQRSTGLSMPSANGAPH
jgi:hypothetical protein